MHCKITDHALLCCILCWQRFFFLQFISLLEVLDMFDKSWHRLKKVPGSHQSIDNFVEDCIWPSVLLDCVYNSCLKTNPKVISETFHYFICFLLIFNLVFNLEKTAILVGFYADIPHIIITDPTISPFFYHVA